jgi:hypothetical protein
VPNQNKGVAIMRRILSMLLAVVMVLSTTVMAAPFQVSTVETAKEASSATDDDVQGELEGEVSYTVKPGINIFTGTTDPLTGENAAMYGSLNVITPNTSKTFLTVAENPDENKPMLSLDRVKEYLGMMSQHSMLVPLAIGLCIFSVAFNIIADAIPGFP